MDPREAKEEEETVGPPDRGTEGMEGAREGNLGGSQKVQAAAKGEKWKRTGVGRREGLLASLPFSPPAQGLHVQERGGRRDSTIPSFIRRVVSRRFLTGKFFSQIRSCPRILPCNVESSVRGRTAVCKNPTWAGDRLLSSLERESVFRKRHLL